MTTATPKPRAGEHVPGTLITRLSRTELERYAFDVRAERDSLAAQNRKLREALGEAVRFIIRTAAHKGNMDAATLAKEEARIMEHTTQLASGRWTGDMVSFDLAAARALLAKHGR